MSNNLSKDYFDCPHCGIKNVTYVKMAEVTEVLHCDMPSDESTPYDKSVPWIEYEISHYIVRCNREDCKRLTYFKIKERFMVPGSGWHNLDKKEVEIQYPSEESDLPDYVHESIRKYYKEAVSANNFGLLSSSSVMCRKVIYELCDKQKAKGKDYKEKIKNLGFDKRITDPLLNIKNIGDETVHAKGWDKDTVQKAIDAIGIIIDMIYTQENRIKDFSKHYTKVNKQRKKATQQP